MAAAVPAAAAAAAVPNDLEHAFITCGVPQQNVALFIQASGVASVDQLNVFTHKDGPKAIIESYHGLLPNTAPGRARRVGARVQACLSALIWLVQRKVSWQQAWDPTEWTPATVNTVLQEMRHADSAQDKTETEPKWEDMKTGIDYETWRDQFESHVTSQLSSDNLTSMAYLLRRANAPPLPITASTAEQRIRNTPHQGPHFEADSAKLYRILEQVTIKDEGAHQWVRPFKSTNDGRGAWNALIGHYEGTTQCSIRVGNAEKVVAPGGTYWDSECHICANLCLEYLPLHTISMGTKVPMYSDPNRREHPNYRPHIEGQISYLVASFRLLYHPPKDVDHGDYLSSSFFN